MRPASSWRISAIEPAQPFGAVGYGMWLSRRHAPGVDQVKERPLRERTTPSIRSRVDARTSWVMARFYCE